VARSSFTPIFAVTVPPPWWVNGRTIERRTLGSRVSDFSAIVWSSMVSAKSKVCAVGEWFTSETKA